MGNRIESLATWAAVIVWLIADSWYCKQILDVRSVVEPALATWVIFGIATTLSLASYLKHANGGQPFIANAANRLDPIVSWMISFVVAFSPRVNVRFSWFDVACIIAVGVILVAWAITQSALKANLLLNAVICAGYLPTFYRLFCERRNTESFPMWELNLVVGSLFLIAPIRRKDLLGVVYSARGVLSVGLLLVVMAYFQFFGPR
jgi:hypothetical protein